MKKFTTLIFTALFLVANFQMVFAAEEVAEPVIDWVQGPAKVDIGTDLATLDLPENYIFADAEDSKTIMTEIDNSITGREQGIVYSMDENKDWFILFEYDDVGYISDSDADDIDADELLESYTQATKEDNQKREASGTSPINVIGWDQSPHYDTATNNLVWSMLGESDGVQLVNYNVRLLGRGGYVSVTLVADKAELDQAKPELDLIISKFQYKDGKKYSDYTAGDKVSDLGLMGLIAGGTVAAKTGLIAKILFVIKKVAVFILVAFGGIVAAIKKKLSKKKASSYNTSVNYNNTTSYNNNEGISVKFNEMDDSNRTL